MLLPNYLWVSIISQNSGSGTVAVAPTREVDCFDSLTISVDYSGNSSLASIAAVVVWKDQNGVTCYTETIGVGSGSTGSLGITTHVKGAEASLSLTGPLDSTFTFGFTAILINFSD